MSEGYFRAEVLFLRSIMAEINLAEINGVQGFDPARLKHRMCVLTFYHNRHTQLERFTIQRWRVLVGRWEKRCRKIPPHRRDKRLATLAEAREVLTMLVQLRLMGVLDD